MEKQSVTELIEKYKLPESEHKTVLELLKNNLFTDKIAEEKPSIMFVVGQPGCGKTTFIKNTNFPKYTL